MARYKVKFYQATTGKRKVEGTFNSKTKALKVAKFINKSHLRANARISKLKKENKDFA